METKLRVLVVTCEWPSAESTGVVPFVVQEVAFLRKAGVQVDVFHFRGARNPLNYLSAWLRVRKQMSRLHYDVIHAQWGQSALLALPKRRPLVITFRGSDLQGIVTTNGRYTLSGLILRAVSRSVARFADQLIVVSRRLSQRLDGLPCHIIPSGVDLDLFRTIPKDEAREKVGLQLNKQLILFAGGPNQPVKRYLLAREAVARLRAQPVPDLVVVDRVPHHLMPYYLSACDVLLLTSSHEGSPNIVKEALACNLPVVSVDVGDVRERLNSVEGCVVCDDDRPETIAKGLAEVLAKHARLNSRQSVYELDERLLVGRIIAIYRKAMGKSNSAPNCELDSTFAKPTEASK